MLAMLLLPIIWEKERERDSVCFTEDCEDLCITM